MAVDERGSEVDAPPVIDPGFENVGCALLHASAAATLVITLIAGFGFPFLMFIVFPFALLAALLLGFAIGMPLFTLAAKLRIAGPVSAGLGGFFVGGMLPIISILAGSGEAWVGVLQMGGAGVVGGLVFWFQLFPRSNPWR